MTEFDQDRGNRSLSPAVTLGCFALDLALVVTFAILGRASHNEGILGPAGAGLLQTAWPFSTGLVVGWLLMRAWRAPLAPVRTGLALWVVTLTAGMLLRVASDQGAALPFVIVAAVTLLVMLVGWRAIVALIRSRAARSAPAGHTVGE